MVLPWDKDFLSSETELSSKTILYASEGQNVNNVSRSIVKKILCNIDSKDYLSLPLEEIASQNFIFLFNSYLIQLVKVSINSNRNFNNCSALLLLINCKFVSLIYDVKTLPKISYSKEK